MLSEQDKKDLELIEKQFHKLICATCAFDSDFELPSLDEAAKNIVDEGQRPRGHCTASTPAGGFSYNIFRDENGSLYLSCNRFCWGSEKTYKV